MPPLPSRSSHSPLPYSKDDKLKKTRPFALPPSAHPRHIYILTLVSFLCLLIGVVGIVFSISALRRPPRTVTVYRCGRSEDTLRTHLSRSGAGGGDGGDARPKLLGFVGVQTGFGSSERRAALRSTWFPSDPDGLVKYGSTISG